MGLFVYTQKGSIISMVDLPTTEIIEPFLEGVEVIARNYQNLFPFTLWVRVYFH